MAITGDIHVNAIPIFNDNYIWVIHNQNTGKAVAVDPGTAAPLEAFLQEKNLELTSLLITHHHHDHIGGINDLRRHRTDLKVYGPRYESIDGITHPLEDGDQIQLPDINSMFKVIHTPGHTLGHICYLSPSPYNWLFCGDTLFSGGCGRLFEGTPAQMYFSLKKLAELAQETLVFCAHEYTESNLRFAVKADPNNIALQEYRELVSEKRKKNQMTLPSTIGLECQINPFIRSDLAELTKTVGQAAQKMPETGVETFAALRAWKDFS